MWQLARIARAHVSGGDPVLLHLEVEERIHVAQDDHVCVQQNHSLFERMSVSLAVRIQYEWTSYIVLH